MGATNGMNIPQPSTPDDVERDILAFIFGPHSLVVYIFVVLNCAVAWYSFAKAARERGLRVAKFISKMGWTDVVRVTAAFLGCVLAQSTFLFASYTISIALAHHPSFDQLGFPDSAPPALWIPPARVDINIVSGVWLALAFLLITLTWIGSIASNARAGDLLSWPSLAVLSLMLLLLPGQAGVAFLPWLLHLVFGTPSRTTLADLAWLGIEIFYTIVFGVSIYLPEAFISVHGKTIVSRLKSR